MIGQTISHYKITAKLGAGGMGEVYLATDTKLDRQVALKFLPESLRNDPEARQRLLREAKAASKLNHPNILTVHAVEEAEGRDFIAMEYAEGSSLKDLIKSGDQDICRIIELAIQIGEGLAEAHAAGVIHRDIKSDNVIVSAKDKAKIMDFGLATWRGATQLTKEGSTVGTMAYMSPEQAQGQPVDQRTDLWSLGVILYEMVSRRLPFEGEHDAAITYSIVNEAPHPLARYSAGVPEELQRIVSKCLNKNRDERYQSALDLVADLRALRRFSSGGAVPAAKPSRKRSRLIAILAVVGVAVVAVVAAFLTDLLKPEETAITPERKMLVVLPFDNLGTDDQRSFADGITEEITTQVAKISALGVISRTTAIKYRDTEKDLREIGAELGVDYVLEGSIRWDETGTQPRVRINPQLIRVADDTHVWTETYDHVLEKIFSVQTDIAEKVASALNVTLLQREQVLVAERPTEILDAYVYYLRGLQYDDHLTRESLENAVTMYRRAIELDSNFALAYARLAMVHADMYGFLFDPTSVRATLAKQSVDRALALAPQLPEAHLASGWYHVRIDEDFERAKTALSVALEAKPNDAEILRRLAIVHAILSEYDEAIEYCQRAIRLFPLDANVARSYAGCLYQLRRYDEGDSLLNRAILLDPQLEINYLVKAWSSFYCRGNTTLARNVLQHASDRIDPSHRLKIELDLDIADGQFKRALALLDKWDSIAIISSDSAHYYTYKAFLYRELDSTHLVDVYSDSMRILAEQQILRGQGFTPDWSPRMIVALAYLFRGRTEDAIRKAEEAIALARSPDGKLIEPDAIKALAHVYSLAGEPDRAIDQVEYLLATPSWYSADYLRIAPELEALHDNPRFQALLEKGHKVF